MKNLIYIFIGVFCQVLSSYSQSADSINTLLSNPMSNYQLLQQTIDSYISAGGTLDQNLLKNYSRSDAYYGLYKSDDGTTNNFYPSFLIQNTATSQSLPTISGSVLPTKPWESLGPKFINNTKGYNGRITSIAIDVVNNYVYAGSENGGLWKKKIGTDDWENITDKFGFPALGIHDIAINPSNPLDIYCATGIHKYQGMNGYGLGVIHTINGGLTWSRENISTNVTYNKEALSVAFTTFSPYVIFAGVGNDLYRKSGNTWTSVYSTALPAANANYRQIIRDIKFIKPLNAGIQSKIIISTHTVSDQEDAHIAVCNLNSNNTPTGSWTKFDLSNGLVSHTNGITRRIAIDVSDSPSQKLYASYNVVVYGATTILSSDVEVIESTDYGVTWNQTPLYHKHGSGYYDGTGLYRNDLSISKDDENTYYNATVRLRKSVNNQTSGDDWIGTSALHDDIRDIKIVKRNNIEEVWVAHDGGIHRSTDGGVTWILEHKNMIIGEYYDVGVCEKDNRIIAGALDVNTHVYFNNNWKKIGGGDGSGSHIFKSNIDFALASNNGNLYTYNFMSGWTNTIHSKDASGFWLDAPFVQNPINDSKVLFGQHQLYEYELNGSKTQIGTFTAPPNSSISKISAMAMSHQTEQNIYVTKHSEYRETFDVVWKTTDKGAHWIDISSNVSFDKNQTQVSPFWYGIYPTDIIVSPTNDQQVYLSLGGVKDDWYKVIYSDKGGELNSDGTSSWIDFSGSLPNIVIHELEILDSYPHDILLAATDLGIYYRKLDGVSNWNRFNHGLPPSIIKNLEIRYCSQELYIATHGHGVFKADISELFENEEDVVVDFGNTLNWTTNKTFYKDVIIGENSTLNITGATVMMAGGAKIIVKPGARLNINNSTITSYCNSFWSGIEIWSDVNATTQLCNTPNCLVGRVDITNSTISYADNAIVSDKPGFYVHGGGVINANNARFLNNRRAIVFAKFENHNPSSGAVISNISSFKNCTFEIDANYLFDVKPPRDQMVSAWEVRGIKFLACDFKNTSTEILEVVGIYTHNANFTVSDICTSMSIPCTSSNPSTFTNLKSGVTATSSGLDYTFVVDNAEFNDCRFGISVSAVDNATITNNTFNISNDFSYHRPTSIFLDVASQFIVEENTISTTTSYSPPNPLPPFPFTGNDRGIVVKNSGLSSNTIYKNTFNDVNFSNVAYETNYHVDNLEFGLVYRCNQMNNSKTRDFSIYGPVLYTGIAGSQGAVGDPVDNMFTGNIVDSKGHIYNDGANAMTYYYRTNAGGFTFKPVKISSNVSPVDANATISFQNSCESHLTQLDDNPKGLVKDGKSFKRAVDFDDAIADFHQAQYVYVSTIDGGDTYGLLNTVQATSSQTAWEMRTELISASPLSLEVIHETIDEAFLSNALLHDVLMVNPHSVRDEEVMDKLETKTTPMPAYMINTLLGIYEVQTQKDVLEAEMANQMQKASEASRFLMLGWRADTTNPLNDSLLYLTNQINTPEADWAGVKYYLSTDNKNAAIAVMNAIPTKYDLGSWETTNYDELHAYYSNFISLLENNGQGIYNPSASQLATVQQMAADSNRKAGRMAQNQVLWAQNKTYWPVIEDEPSNKRETKDPRAKRVETERTIVKMYPSPANSYITIEMVNIQSEEQIRISVINTAGVELLNHMERMENGGVINLMTQDLASGQYFVLIYQGNEVLQKQSIEVIH